MQLKGVGTKFNTEEVQGGKHPAEAVLQAKSTSFSGSTPPITTDAAKAFESYSAAQRPLSYRFLGEVKIPFSNNAHLYKLENGQRVVIVPKKGPTVINTHFNVGSMNEPDNLRGISHFVEHNLFNGTDELNPGDFFKKTNNMGAQVNASTGFAKTSYYINSQLLNKQDFEHSVKMHADMIQNPKFDADQIEKEKGPVTSEISMVTDAPSNILVNTAVRNLFGIKASSPDLIAGSIGNINGINRDILVDYYKKYYTPDNAVTVITGDVEPSEVIDVIAKNFTSYKPAQNVQRQHETLTPIETSMRQDLKAQRTDSTLIALAFAGPSNADTKGKILVDALGVLLCAHPYSRLNKALDKIGTQADVSLEKISNQKDAPSALIFSTKVLDAQSESAIKIMYDELAKIAANPPSEQELKTVKNRLKLYLSDVTEHSQLLNDVIGDSFLDNDVNYLSKYIEIVESMKPEDLSEVARKYVDLNKSALTVVHPQSVKDETILKNYTAKNSQNISFTGKQEELPFEAVETSRLQNNMQVLFNPNKSANALYRMVFDTKIPADVDPAVPYILSRMLNRGSMNKTWEEFSEIAYNNTIDLAFKASSNAINITGRSLDEDLEKSLNLAKEVLLSPRFTQENFEDSKNILKASLKGAPNSASDKLYEELFSDMPFSASKERILKGIDRVTLEDVMGFYLYIIQNAQAKTVLTAPFDEKPHLKQAVETILSKNVSSFKPFRTDLFESYEPLPVQKVIYRAEERNQAEIPQAFKFRISGNAEDAVKYELTNIILGASPSSRLFSDLREKQKLAYRVNSSLDYIGNTGIIKLFISTTTNDSAHGVIQPENIKKSLDGFKSNIEQMKTSVPSDFELETAKNIFKSRLRSSMETSLGQNTTLSASYNTPYGVSYMKKLYDTVDKITPEDIKSAANYMFDANSITSILASEKSLQSSGLAKY